MRLSYFLLIFAVTLVTTDAAAPHHPNDKPTIAAIHDAIDKQTPFTDSKGVSWNVHCSHQLPHDITKIERLLPLIPLNSVPVIVSDESLIDFFAGLAALPTTCEQTWIGQKYLYPNVFALESKKPAQHLINVFLVRLINDSDKTHYLTTPKTAEIELAYQQEFQRIHQASLSTIQTINQQTVKRMKESVSFGIFKGFILGYALNEGVHVFVLTLVACSLCDSLLKIFRTIGLLPQKFWG